MTLATAPAHHITDLALLFQRLDITLVWLMDSGISPAQIIAHIEDTFDEHVL